MATLDNGNEEDPKARPSFDPRWVRDLGNVVRMTDTIVRTLEALGQAHVVDEGFLAAVAEWKTAYGAGDGKEAVYPPEERLNRIVFGAPGDAALRAEVTALRADIEQMRVRGLQGKQLELKVRVLEEQYQPIKEWVEQKQQVEFAEELRDQTATFLEGATTLASSIPFGEALSELAAFGRMGILGKAKTQG